MDEIKSFLEEQGSIEVTVSGIKMSRKSFVIKFRSSEPELENVSILSTWENDPSWLPKKGSQVMLGSLSVREDREGEPVVWGSVEL